MNKLKAIIWIISIAFFSYLMLQLTLPYVSLKSDVDFLATKQNIIHIKQWRYAFYTHVFFSILTLIAGLTQFSNYILKRIPRVHRMMGYIYVVDVVAIAGPSGLIMGIYSNGDWFAALSFVILSVLWIIITLIALFKVYKKQYIDHRTWMIRSYALTLSAVTLRLLAIVVPIFFQLKARDEYSLISWLSWTLNLAVAELYIRFFSQKVD